jgi:hypothetical protein
MGYTLDYFVGHLVCPRCGTTSPADESTNMATYIRDEPQLAYMGVGHPLHVNLEEMNNRGYLMVRRPLPGESIHILHTWECPACGQAFNWAEIVVKDEAIEQIKAASLDRETLERAHFISREVVNVVSKLTGKPFAELVDADLVSLLRQHIGSAKLRQN